MTSNQPYFIRAVYQWIIDNHCTPYVVIDTETEGVQAPGGYDDEGKLVLNISPHAAIDLQITNHDIKFDATFSGEHNSLVLPMHSILAIYAQENGRGMVFSEAIAHDESEPGHVLDADDSSSGSKKPSHPTPILRLVK